MKKNTGRYIFKFSTLTLLVLMALPSSTMATTVVNSIHVEAVSGGQKTISGTAGEDGEDGQKGADGTNGMSAHNLNVTTGDVSGFISVKSVVDGVTVVDFSTTTKTTHNTWLSSEANDTTTVGVGGEVKVATSGIPELKIPVESNNKDDEIIQKMLKSIHSILLFYVNRFF